MKAFTRIALAGILFAVIGATSSLAAPRVLLNEAEFRDRVFACWLGKNIGGTLGMPFEGRQEPQNISFYTNLKTGEPAANDDLDLQILWLKAMREHNGRVDARILGEYWLKFVPVDWNEYGIGKRNMRLGLLPPLSGEFDNKQWKHSNGAWIRSEIWACLAPGCPALAAKMAREDACVDHGAAEGTIAEIFTASLESAAFIEKDRDKLIELGLSMIPRDSQVAIAVRAAVDAKKAGKDWKTARLDVIKASESTGWFQAPRNVAYTMIGWLYGDGDFGQSLCIAVNCGDDTDCTGATLGSILGIIHGTAGIPEKWSKPIGLEIKTVAISGFKNESDLNQLTDETLKMTKKVLAINNAPVGLTVAPSDLTKARKLKLTDPKAAKALWELSPYQIVWNEEDVRLTLDYLCDPVIEKNKARGLSVTVANLSKSSMVITPKLIDAPAGWQITGLPSQGIKVRSHRSTTLAIQITPTSIEAEQTKMRLDFSGAAEPISIPVTLVDATVDQVGADDLALAANGATVTCDSEYEQEKPCAQKVIDGIIARPEDFSNRWHSALTTPHPHWIEVKLPKPTTISKVVIRFADPQGYPTSFQGLVKPEGSPDLKPIIDVTGNTRARTYRTEIQPVKTDTFRLLIRSSANPAFLNAAQISEIELY